LAIALVVGITSFFAFSRESPRSPLATARVRELVPPQPLPVSPLRHLIDAVDLKGVSFETALDQLASLGDVNIVPRWPTIEATGIKRAHSVTLRLAHVTVHQALTALMADVEDSAIGDSNLGWVESKLGWVERDGIVIVSTRPDVATQDRVLRVYDVRDLMEDAERLHLEIQSTGAGQSGQAQQLANASQGAAPAWPYADEEQRADELIKLVIDNVRPASWIDSGGDVGRCTYWAGQLFVTETDQGQQDVEAFLELLRRRN
jgi:hypothetical protein